MVKKNSTTADLSDIIADTNETVVAVKTTSVSSNVKIDDSTLIRVKSNVFGQLIYVNAKTGDSTIWNKAGEVQTMTINDLRAMKSNQSTFFANQWIVILGVDNDEETKVSPADIYKALGIIGYYKNIVDPSNFEVVCGWTKEEITSNIKLMTESAKVNLVVALNEYISRGVLESLSKIRAFERALGCELVIPE